MSPRVLGPDGTADGSVVRHDGGVQVGAFSNREVNPAQKYGAADVIDQAPPTGRQRSLGARRRDRRGAARAVLSRLPGVVVLVAASAARGGCGRLPRGRDGHARLRRHHPAHRDRRLQRQPLDRRRRRSRGGTRRAAGSRRRARLGCADRLVVSTRSPRRVPRRRRHERALPRTHRRAARRAHAQRRDADGGGRTRCPICGIASCCPAPATGSSRNGRPRSPTRCSGSFARSTAEAQRKGTAGNTTVDSARRRHARTSRRIGHHV